MKEKDKKQEEKKVEEHKKLNLILCSRCGKEFEDIQSEIRWVVKNEISYPVCFECDNRIIIEDKEGKRIK